jgi:hypothetical protein
LVIPIKSGTYTVELNVTTAKSSVTGYKAQLVRVNSSCGVVTTLATSSSQSGTGLKTFTFRTPKCTCLGAVPELRPIRQMPNKADRRPDVVTQRT